MHLGGRLVIETVDAILEGKVKSIPQEEMAVAGELRPAPKIFKETCRIDWNQPVKKIYDFIRGLSPYPAAWSELITSEEGAAVVVKIFESEKIYESHQISYRNNCDRWKEIHESSCTGWICIYSFFTASR